MKQGIPTESNHLVAPAADPPVPPDDLAARRERHLAEITAETNHLTAMDWPALGAELKNIIAGNLQVSTEALVRICRRIHEEGDRRKLNLAFEAVSFTATPALLRRLARDHTMTPEDREDGAQQILLELFKAISSGKSSLAETFFAAFAKRRAVDLFRRRQSKIEGKLHKAESTDDLDPLDTVPARQPSAEARALAAVAIDKLPTKLRVPFVQRHRLDMKQEEIAHQHGVDVRTVRTWLKTAEEMLGMHGEDNDC